VVKLLLSQKYFPADLHRAHPIGTRLSVLLVCESGPYEIKPETVQRNVIKASIESLLISWRILRTGIIACLNLENPFVRDCYAVRNRGDEWGLN
jgi:hypothetical protein